MEFSVGILPPDSYILTISVTVDQEQAIKNLCLLREWPYTKYSPMAEERGRELQFEMLTSTANNIWAKA